MACQLMQGGCGAVRCGVAPGTRRWVRCSVVPRRARDDAVGAVRRRAAPGTTRWVWCGVAPVRCIRGGLRRSRLVQNPSSNKDAPVETLASAVRELQTKKKRLMLLDEFSMLFLYQALKANDH